MRHLSGILIILALIGAFMLPGIARQAGLRRVPEGTAWAFAPLPNTTGTPRAAFPLIIRNPTLTPTRTPTATITPTATKTALPTATRTGVPGATGLTGRLVFVEPRTQYYTHIEWIFFWEQIYNPTGGPLPYTLLGVNVTGPDLSWVNPRFHTSWTGSPDYVLSGCWGPNGHTDWNIGHNYRCAPNQNEGWHKDHIGAASSVELKEPGHYWIKFWACVSSYYVCTTPGQPAVWRDLQATLELDAVLPPASAQGSSNITPVPQTKCGLITDDPNNIYLKCDE